MHLKPGLTLQDDEYWLAGKIIGIMLTKFQQHRGEGSLSIPRDLGLIRDSGSYWLTQTPIQELAVLRNSALGGVTRLRDKLLTNRTPEELQNFRATAFDAELVIDVAGLPEVGSEIKIQLRSSNTGQGMVLAWRRTGSNQGELSLTRSAAEAGGSTSELTQPESGFIGRWSSTSFPLAAPTPQQLVSGFGNARPSEQSQIKVPIVAPGTNNRLLKLRILVDRSSVEVFAGDGTSRAKQFYSFLMYLIKSSRCMRPGEMQR